MDQNNSSSNENQRNIYDVQIEEPINENDFKNLRYENFQLRLRCYNYEKLVNELCVKKNSENESVLLQKELFEKTEELQNLETEMLQLKNDYYDVKMALEETEKPKSDHESQCNLILDSRETLIEENKLVVESLLGHIGSLQNENESLNESIVDLKKSMEKRSTTSISVNTDDTLPLTTSNDDTKFDQSMISSKIISNSEDSTVYLSPHLTKSLNTLDEMLNYFNKSELDFEQMETAMMDVAEQQQRRFPKKNKCAAFDDDFRLNLYSSIKRERNIQETDDNDKIDNNDRLNTLLVEFQEKIVEKDLEEGFKQFSNTKHFVKKSITESNPNSLAMNTLLKKLEETSSKIGLVKQKIHKNEDWNQIATKAHICDEDPLKSSLSADLKLFNENIVQLSTTFINLLPEIKQNFKNTKIHLNNIKQFMNIDQYREELYGRFIELHHQHIERVLNDHFNCFIQSSRDCVNLLSKQHELLDNTQGSFDEWLLVNGYTTDILSKINSNTGVVLVEEENNAIKKFQNVKCISSQTDKCDIYQITSSTQTDSLNDTDQVNDKSSDYFNYTYVNSLRENVTGNETIDNTIMEEDMSSCNQIDICDVKIEIVNKYIQNDCEIAHIYSQTDYLEFADYYKEKSCQNDCEMAHIYSQTDYLEFGEYYREKSCQKDVLIEDTYSQTTYLDFAENYREKSSQKKCLFENTYSQTKYMDFAVFYTEKSCQNSHGHVASYSQTGYADFADNYKETSCQNSCGHMESCSQTRYIDFAENYKENSCQNACEHADSYSQTDYLDYAENYSDKPCQNSCGNVDSYSQTGFSDFAKNYQDVACQNSVSAKKIAPKRRYGQLIRRIRTSGQGDIGSDYSSDKSNNSQSLFDINSNNNNNDNDNNSSDDNMKDNDKISSYLENLPLSIPFNHYHSMYEVNPTENLLNPLRKNNSISSNDLHINNSNLTYHSYSNTNARRNLLKNRFRRLDSTTPQIDSYCSVPSLQRNRSEGMKNIECTEVVRTKICPLPNSSNTQDVNNQKTIINNASNSQSGSELFKHLKLRIMKLLLLHDIRGYLHTISQYNTTINDYYSDITKQIINMQCLDSDIFVELRQNWDEWRHNVELFQKWLHNNSTIPALLLAISDEELIHLTFVKGSSKLDFPINESDINKFTENVNKSFNELNKYYKNLFTKQNKYSTEIFKIQQNTNINVELTQLESVNENLQHMIQLKSNEIEKLTKDLSAKQTEITSKTNYITVLRNDLQETQNNVDSLKEENKKQRLKLDETGTELIKQSDINYKTKMEYDDLIDENRKLTADVQKVCNYNLSLEKDQEATKTCINTLKEHEKQLLLENQEHQETIRKISSKHKKLQSEYFSMNEEYDEIKAYHEQTIQKYNSIKEENEKLTKEQKNFQNLIENMKKIQDNQEEEMKKIQDQQKEENQSQVEALYKNQAEISSIRMVTKYICKKVNKLIFQIMELYEIIDKNFSHESFDKQFDVSTEWLPTDSEVIKQLKAANIYLGVMTKIVNFKNQEFSTLYLPKDSKKKKDFSYNKKQYNLPERKYAASKIDEIYDLKKSMIPPRGKLSKHQQKKFKEDKDVSVTPESMNYLKIPNNRVTNKKMVQNAKKDGSPLYERNNAQHKYVNHHKNKNNDQPTFTNSEEENGEEPVSVTSSFSVTSSLDEQQHVTSRNENEKFNEGDNVNADNTGDSWSETLSHGIVEENGNTPKRNYYLEKLSEILNKCTDDDSNDSCSETKVTRDETNSSLADWNQLIATNNDLTQNLISASQKLSSYQNKLELQSGELRQLQTARNDILIELRQKYTKIAELEQQFDLIKNSLIKADEVNRKLQSQVEQQQNEIQEKDEQIKQKIQEIRQMQKQAKRKGRVQTRNVSLQVRLKEPRSRTNTAEDKGNNSYTQIQSKEEKPPIPNARIGSTASQICTGEDWEDVTRTMIRCLTTLSEVQDSLGGDCVAAPSNLVNHQDPHNIQHNLPGNNPCGATSSGVFSDKLDISTVSVVLIKERKFLVIQKFIIKIQAVVNRIKVTDINLQDPSLDQSKNLINKLISLMDATDYYKMANIHEQAWVNLTKTSILTNYLPYSNYFNSTKDDCDNTVGDLDDINKVENPVMLINQLQHKLLRYQSRYRGLKKAVFNKKIQLKNDADTVPDDQN